MPQPSVLIVDDNAPLADNLSEILADRGYAVQIANTCAAALAVGSGFDVALVDVRLPDGGGIELVGQLKARWPDAEVVLLTGFASVESAAAAVRAGARAYLVKPCNTEDLLLTVGQAIRHVKLLAEKRTLTRRAHVAEKLAAVGTLAAGLSHEIRNPLNAASLQLALCERRVGKLPAELQGAVMTPLAIVRHEIDRLNGILENFLAFARPREFEPAEVDLTALLGRVLDLLTAQAEQSRVSLEREFSSLPPVLGEPGRLQQAVMNLVLNGIQAAPSEGWVRVGAQEIAGAGEVQIVVEDSGPGVLLEARRRMFEPFYTTKEGGNGLGMPLVHSVVDQHGGVITLEEGGHGARFVVRLPTARPR